MVCRHSSAVRKLCHRKARGCHDSTSTLPARRALCHVTALHHVQNPVGREQSGHTTSARWFAQRPPAVHKTPHAAACVATDSLCRHRCACTPAHHLVRPSGWFVGLCAAQPGLTLSVQLPCVTEFCLRSNKELAPQIYISRCVVSLAVLTFATGLAVCQDHGNENSCCAAPARQ